MSKENKDDTAKEAEPKTEGTVINLGELIAALLKGKEQALGLTEKDLEAHKAFYRKLLALIEEHTLIWGGAVDSEAMVQSVSATLMHTSVQTLFDIGESKEEIAKKVSHCIAMSIINRELGIAA